MKYVYCFHSCWNEKTICTGISSKIIINEKRKLLSTKKVSRDSILIAYSDFDSAFVYGYGFNSDFWLSFR